MPVYKNVKPTNYYPNPEQYFRNISEPLGIRSILDVGAGHGGVFDYGYWTEKSEVYKEACDLVWIRPMDPRWKITTGVDVERLSEFYGEKSFDMVQCMETLEHVKNSDKALEELAKVAKKLVILSSCDKGHHIGTEQDALEKINPAQAFVAQPSVKTMKKLGYEVRVEHYERRQLVAWKLI